MNYRIELPTADLELQTKCYRCAEKIYGSPLPDTVRSRLDLELNSITSNQYAGMYLIASEISDVNSGLPISARGTLGASFVCFLLRLCTVNPLPAHYHCPVCHHFEEIDDMGPTMACDMPVKKCPCCSADMLPDGYELLPEMHMGINLDREPNFSLNLTKEGRRLAIEHLKDVYGETCVLRAGVKRVINTTGKMRRSFHPGGLYIVPHDCDVSAITALRPCDPGDEHRLLITEEDFTDLDAKLKRLDLFALPQNDMLYALQQETKFNYNDIPLFALNDPGVLMIAEQQTNLYPPLIAWYPSEQTRRKAFRLTYPMSLSDLIRLEGLLHGVGTWSNNAENLVKEGRSLHELLTCRDDLIDRLLAAGIEKDYAFSILGRLRPGKGLTDKMIADMKEVGIPDCYLNSLNRIIYLFSRSQTIEYALADAKIAFYRDGWPEEFEVIFEYIAALYGCAT